MGKSSSVARGGVGAVAVIALLGCAPDFSTTRTAPPVTTLGRVLYSVVCDRVGAQSLPTDVTGGSFQSICHPDATGKYGERVDVTQLPPLQDPAYTPSGELVPLAQQQASRTYEIARVEALGRDREDGRRGARCGVPRRDASRSSRPPRAPRRATPRPSPRPTSRSRRSSRPRWGGSSISTMTPKRRSPALHAPSVARSTTSSPIRTFRGRSRASMRARDTARSRSPWGPFGPSSRTPGSSSSRAPSWRRSSRSPACRKARRRSRGTRSRPPATRSSARPGDRRRRRWRSPTTTIDPMVPGARCSRVRGRSLEAMRDVLSLVSPDFASSDSRLPRPARHARLRGRVARERRGAPAVRRPHRAERRPRRPPRRGRARPVHHDDGLPAVSPFFAPDGARRPARRARTRAPRRRRAARSSTDTSTPTRLRSRLSRVTASRSSRPAVR